MTSDSAFENRLWEQACDDGAATGDFTLAHQIELNSRLAKEASLADERNDAAIIKLAHLSSIVPETVEDYLLIKAQLLETSGDFSLRDDVRKLSEDTRLEFAEIYPELDRLAREAQLAETQEKIAAMGLGKALRTY